MCADREGMVDPTDLEAIRNGDLDADAVWAILAPHLGDAGRADAERACAALRSWAWKALDRRRRDRDLVLWIDLLNRAEALLEGRFPDLGARLALLSEMVHESLAVAALSCDGILGRNAVRDIVERLASDGYGWTPRSGLAEAAGLTSAGTARVVRLLVNLGHVEERRTDGEPEHRLSVEGRRLLGHGSGNAAGG